MRTQRNTWGPYCISSGFYNFCVPNHLFLWTSVHATPPSTKWDEVQGVFLISRLHVRVHLHLSNTQLDAEVTGWMQTTPFKQLGILNTLWLATNPYAGILQLVWWKRAGKRAMQGIQHTGIRVYADDSQTFKMPDLALINPAHPIPC